MPQHSPWLYDNCTSKRKNAFWNNKHLKPAHYFSDIVFSKASLNSSSLYNSALLTHRKFITLVQIHLEQTECIPLLVGCESQMPCTSWGDVRYEATPPAPWTTNKSVLLNLAFKDTKWFCLCVAIRLYRLANSTLSTFQELLWESWLFQIAKIKMYPCVLGHFRFQVFVGGTHPPIFFLSSVVGLLRFMRKTQPSLQRHSSISPGGRRSQSRKDISSFWWILGLIQNLLPVRRAWETFRERCPEGILIRCLQLSFLCKAAANILQTPHLRAQLLVSRI